MSGRFDQKVERHIERLRCKKYNIIEKEVTEKRLSWLKSNFLPQNKIDHPSPRQAYEMLFFGYMGLPANEVPILQETEDKIVWSSKNRCPTLEACLKLNLDTKKVCRAIYEKSTQALISRLHPQLRFYRDYDEIRPYANHCKEMIIRLDFTKFMGLAIKEAKKSRAEGNKGYGAVVVMGEQILARAHDTAITQQDPGQHAEVNALRQAVKTFADTDLCGAVLFSTCEPCPMCTSLAVWSNISTIVYGISIEETSKLGRTRINISSEEIIKRSPVMIEVVKDVLKEECKKLYT
jgi:tRNA(adenine34) deaminase